MAGCTRAQIKYAMSCSVETGIFGAQYFMNTSIEKPWEYWCRRAHRKNFKNIDTKNAGIVDII